MPKKVTHGILFNIRPLEICEQKSALYVYEQNLDCSCSKSYDTTAFAWHDGLSICFRSQLSAGHDSLPANLLLLVFSSTDDLVTVDHVALIGTHHDLYHLINAFYRRTWECIYFRFKPIVYRNICSLEGIELLLVAAYLGFHFCN